MNKAMGLALVIGMATSGLAVADHDDHRYRGDRQQFFAEGRVVQVEPVYETYYYREHSRGNSEHRYEICRTRDVEVSRSHRGGNPAATLIGGAVGATVGSHSGNSPESQVFGAIAGGIIGGAIGHELGGRGETTVRYRTERECEVEYRHRRSDLVGYEVRYRYNGREFMTFMDRHPGRYVELAVEVTPR
ncbi:glycine zipper 2TM domain-containing protein [Saccharospirillum alexandrii]|uniref:glycine zipper 2TM domain-containing protein n=1 Tax=Saccharospirillum alexandrii TaxID=2448477 RepID=UPI000FD87004|nr:glycine zipper 2TM domain-containing protein [Saccharospirillum alexandrii]